MVKRYQNKAHKPFLGLGCTALAHRGLECTLFGQVSALTPFFFASQTSTQAHRPSAMHPTPSLPLLVLLSAFYCTGTSASPAPAPPPQASTSSSTLVDASPPPPTYSLPLYQHSNSISRRSNSDAVRNWALREKGRINNKYGESGGDDASQAGASETALGKRKERRQQRTTALSVAGYAPSATSTSGRSSASTSGTGTRSARNSTATTAVGEVKVLNFEADLWVCACLIRARRGVLTLGLSSQSLLRTGGRWSAASVHERDPRHWVRACPRCFPSFLDSRFLLSQFCRLVDRFVRVHSRHRLRWDSDHQPDLVDLLTGHEHIFLCSIRLGVGFR